MAYQAPSITEVGRFADLTLGQPAWGAQRDSSVYWDPWGDPSRPKPGSR